MNKFLGQNHLVSKTCMDRIRQMLVENVNPYETAQVSEIGFGFCNITQILCEIFSKVIAYDIDPMLWQKATKKKSLLQNVEFRLEDARECEIQSQIVVGNLPFCSSKAILANVMRFNNVNKIFFALQQELGMKILNKIKGIWSWRFRFYFDIVDYFVIPKTSFKPVPKVHTVFMYAIRKEQFSETINKNVNSLSCFLGNAKNKKLKNSSGSNDCLDSLKKLVPDVENLRRHQISIEDFRKACFL